MVEAELLTFQVRSMEFMAGEGALNITVAFVVAEGQR